jgi:hypothetical protein
VPDDRISRLASALENCEKSARTLVYAGALSSIVFLYFFYAIVSFDRDAFRELESEAELSAEMSVGAQRLLDFVADLGDRRSFFEDYGLVCSALMNLVEDRAPVDRETADAALVTALEIEATEMGEWTRNGLALCETFFTYATHRTTGARRAQPLEWGLWSDDDQARRDQRPLEQYSRLVHSLNFYYDCSPQILDPELLGLLVPPEVLDGQPKKSSPSTADDDVPTTRLVLHERPYDLIRDYASLRNSAEPWEWDDFCSTHGVKSNVAGLRTYDSNIQQLVTSLKEREIGTVKLPLIGQTVVLPFMFVVGTPLLVALYVTVHLTLRRRQQIIGRLRDGVSNEQVSTDLELSRVPWLGSLSLGPWGPTASGALFSSLMLATIVSNAMAALTYAAQVGVGWEAVVGLGLGVAGAGIVASLFHRGMLDRIWSAAMGGAVDRNDSEVDQDGAVDRGDVEEKRRDEPSTSTPSVIGGENSPVPRKEVRTVSSEKDFLDTAERLARQSEKIAEKRFKACGFDVSVIPVAQRRRPDLLVTDSAGPVVICEVKTIASAGYLKELGFHASLNDPRFVEASQTMIVVEGEAMPRKVIEALDEAADQYRQLCEDQKELAGVPFVVALFMDFFADCFDLLPTRADAPEPINPDISAVMKVEHAWEARAVLDKYSREQQRDWYDGRLQLELGPITKRWRIRQNETARAQVPEHFLYHYIVD